MDPKKPSNGSSPANGPRSLRSEAENLRCSPSVGGENITVLLGEWRAGQRDAEARLFALITDELRRLAGSHLRREREGHTLQPTALVNEAWMRLAQQETPDFENRAHFFGVAARLMRQILVDHARARGARRRDAGLRVDFTGALDVTADEGKAPERVLALHDALEKLAAFDDRRAKVLELRYFGGLSRDEIATALGVTERIVKRDLVVAQAWLKRELAGS